MRPSCPTDVNGRNNLKKLFSQTVLDLRKVSALFYQQDAGTEDRQYPILSHTLQHQSFPHVVSAYQLGPWCGIVQTVEQNYFHCPSHQHPSGCWHRCTAVGFQYCHNLLLLLSSSWVFSIYSHHQILLKKLCKTKIHNNNLDNIGRK